MDKYVAYFIRFANGTEADRQQMSLELQRKKKRRLRELRGWRALKRRR